MKSDVDVAIEHMSISWGHDENTPMRVRRGMAAKMHMLRRSALSFHSRRSQQQPTQYAGVQVVVWEGEGNWHFCAPLFLNVLSGTFNYHRC